MTYRRQPELTDRICKGSAGTDTWLRGSRDGTMWRRQITRDPGPDPGTDPGTVPDTMSGYNINVIASASSASHGEDRTGGAPHDLIDRRSEEHEIERVAPVDAHDDKIGPPFGGHVENLSIGLALAEA